MISLHRPQSIKTKARQMKTLLRTILCLALVHVRKTMIVEIVNKGPFLGNEAGDGLM